MSEHTPGPWFLHREGCSTVYVEARLQGSMIQEVAACGPTAAGPDQQMANAELIARAPDLLAENERLRDVIDVLTNDIRATRKSDDKSRDENERLVIGLREARAMLGPCVPASVTDPGARYEWEHALEAIQKALNNEAP